MGHVGERFLYFDMLWSSESERQGEGGNLRPSGMRWVNSDGCSGNCGNLKDEEMICRRRAETEKACC